MGSPLESRKKGQFPCARSGPPQLHRLGSVDSVIGSLRFETCSTPFLCDSLSNTPEDFTLYVTPTPAPPQSSDRKRRKTQLQIHPSTGCDASRFHGDYCEHRLIGTGSFSEVFRVRHKIDNTLYALKRAIKLDGSRHFRSLADQIREARILAFLSTPACPWILQYFTSFIEDATLHLVTELCETSARDRYMQTGKFDAQLLADLLHDVASGLAYCHERGVAHLDISPANVLISNTGAFKLADFGLALHIAAYEESDCICSGDARYLAPEVLQVTDRRLLDLFKVDVYALGAAVLACASGADLPGEGQEWQRIRTESELCIVCEYGLQADSEMQHSVELMISRDPQRRPTAAELISPSSPRETASMRE